MDWFDLVLIGMAVAVAIGGAAMIKFLSSDLAARTIWTMVPSGRYPPLLRGINIAVVSGASLALLVAPFFRVDR